MTPTSAQASNSAQDARVGDVEDDRADVEETGSSHSVHFYESESALADRVADFLEAGLRAGDAAIVIATEAHAQLFTRRLEERRHDVAAARASGHLVIHDAQQTLARLSLDAIPDEVRFQEVVGGLIESSTNRGFAIKRLWVFGEMVDILWRGGDRQAALWLEDLWNALARTYPFELLCAYSMDGLFTGPATRELLDVCDRHTAIGGGGPTARATGPATAPAAPVDETTRLLVAEIAHRKEVERALRDCTRELRGARERERRRAHRNIQLQRATASLAAALTQDEVARALLSVTEEVMQTSAGVVYLRGTDGELHLRAARGVTDVERWSVLPRDTPVPLTTAVSERRAVLLANRQALLDQYPNMENSPTPAARLQAVAALPLIHDTRVVGGFAVSFDGAQRFDDEERRWLDSIAAQAALATDRSLLYEAEKRAREEAETLFRIVEPLSAAELDLESLLQRVIDEVTKLTGADFGAFFHNVVDSQGEKYLLYTLSGAPKEAFAKFGLPRNTPLFAPTFGGDGVVRLDDVTKDPRYGQIGPHHGMPEGHLPVTSYLAVPVISRSGAVLGGLFFGHAKPARFTAEHERVTKSIAATAALAVDNAHLFRATLAAEETQRRLIGELRETVHLNDLFVGVLAHDLRSPLTAILAAADMIQSREAATPERKNEKALRRMVASGQRMARMIEQLLDFTRLRFGAGLTIETRPVDLRPLIRQVADELESSQPDRSIEIEAEGDVTGEWDGDRLGQVFSNLLGNALQHGAAVSPVRVAIDGSAAETIRVRVHNLGTIPRELVPKVFEPMIAGDRRGDGSRGLGLGLFITREIAQAHGGTVEVDSSEDAGTAFTLVLPRFVERSDDGAHATKDRLEQPDATHASLRESEGRFRLLVDAVKDYAIFMLDPRGRVVTWNGGAKRIKGYEASEIVGQHFSRFYPEEDVRAGKCQHELEVAAREGRFEEEGWRLRKDGSRFWANVVITAVRGPTAQLMGFTKVTRDLTDRRQLQEEQIRAAKAEEALRLRDEFLVLVSHELKTPLTILQMQLDTLPRALGSLDQRVVAKLRRATQSSQRLAALIESLLDVSSMTTSRFVVEPEPFDLADSLAWLVDDLRPVTASAGCALTLRTSGELTGVWDQLRIEQAVTSLISNAIKYGAGKPVDLSVVRRGDLVLIDVRDRGPGIPEDELVRIFERFERAQSTLNHGGLGLGLYLTHQIAIAHRGTVRAWNVSDADGGACFQIALPAHATTGGAGDELAMGDPNR